jgi:hypothetical protein
MLEGHTRISDVTPCAVRGDKEKEEKAVKHYVKVTCKVMFHFQVKDVVLSIYGRRDTLDLQHRALTAALARALENHVFVLLPPSAFSPPSFKHRIAFLTCIFILYLPLPVSLSLLFSGAIVRGITRSCSC